MFESLVSRLTSPTVSRRRHTVHAAREVCSEPEEEAAPVQRRTRTAKQLLDKRRKARLSCADLTTAGNAEPEKSSRIEALKAFLPLRQSKSLGRLDGLKEPTPRPSNCETSNGSPYYGITSTCKR
ncbi:hypothetical protein RR48_08665 [Papilio machaon]|uniref:Uncharacterized protein n=1 Tax=Papilio machaon TaxID=76193 RepID=A0A194RD65_PAPMA|nr:hypothetical protein RR48_08665 [Papilio machaon]